MDTPKATNTQEATRRTQIPRDGGRYVILRHERGEDVHWDFMLEVAGVEGLVTWQIRLEPTRWVQAGRLEALRLADHRKAYLTYEGEISGGRGRVVRVEEGRYEMTGRIEEGPVRIVAGGRVVQAQRTSAQRWEMTVSAA